MFYSSSDKHKCDVRSANSASVLTCFGAETTNDSSDKNAAAVPCMMYHMVNNPSLIVVLPVISGWMEKFMQILLLPTLLPVVGQKQNVCVKMCSPHTCCSVTWSTLCSTTPLSRKLLTIQTEVMWSAFQLSYSTFGLMKEFSMLYSTFGIMKESSMLCLVFMMTLTNLQKLLASNWSLS